MVYCVDLRNKETGNTEFVILETDCNIKAWSATEEYNNGTGIYSQVPKEYPREKYFADVFEDDTRADNEFRKGMFAILK